MDKTTLIIGKYVLTVSSANRPSDDALRQAAQFLVDKFERDRVREDSENRSA